MEGFKKLPKMQSFKIGGSVKQQFAALEKKERKTEEKADTAQDKAMVKKGVRQHETALHKGEPKTELKLKTGGRVKKAAGTVKKFDKASGQYGAKKTAEDKKAIKEAKLFKPAKNESKAVVKAKGTGAKTTKASGDKDAIKKVADTSKKAATPTAAAKVKNTPAKFCGGRSVKKMAEGKSVKQPGATEAQQKFYDKNMAEADKKAKEKDYEIFGSRGDAARKGMEEGRMDAMGNAYKKGGKAKVKKYADGGAVFSDEEKAWLGGADATDPYILARMRSALGPRPQTNYVPNANPAMDNRDVGLKENARPAANISMDNRDIGGAAVTPLSGKSYADLPSDTLGAKPAAPKQNYIPNANAAMDNRDVGMPTKPAPYINIPANNPGLKQFNQDATSPAGNFWRWLTSTRSKRNRSY